MPPDVTSRGPQMNSVEQVSSVGHRISVAGCRSQVWCPGGTLECDVSHDAFVTYPSHFEQKDAWENITFQQIRLRAVTILYFMEC